MNPTTWPFVLLHKRDCVDGLRGVHPLGWRPGRAKWHRFRRMRLPRVFFTAAYNLAPIFYLEPACPYSVPDLRMRRSSCGREHAVRSNSSSINRPAAEETRCPAKTQASGNNWVGRRGLAVDGNAAGSERGAASTVARWTRSVTALTIDEGDVSRRSVCDSRKLSGRPTQSCDIDAADDVGPIEGPNGDMRVPRKNRKLDQVIQDPFDDSLS